jgi:hypothetical protein
MEAFGPCCFVPHVWALTFAFVFCFKGMSRTRKGKYRVVQIISSYYIYVFLFLFCVASVEITDKIYKKPSGDGDAGMKKLGEEARRTYQLPFNSRDKFFFGYFVDKPGKGSLGTAV